MTNGSSVQRPGHCCGRAICPTNRCVLIGAGLSGWADQAVAQSDLFAPAAPVEESDSILATIDTVTEKYGKPLLGVGLSRKNSAD